MDPRTDPAYWRDRLAKDENISPAFRNALRGPALDPADVPPRPELPADIATAYARAEAAQAVIKAAEAWADWVEHQTRATLAEESLYAAVIAYRAAKLADTTGEP